MTRYKLGCVFVIACFLIAACAVSATPISKIVPTQSKIEVTQTFLPQVTLILTQTQQPPDVTIATTITPRPTLNPTDADMTIARFMRENGNCAVPCFWGITPGSSSLADSVEFITTLSNSFNRDVFIQTKNSEIYYSAEFFQKGNMAIGMALLGRDEKLVNASMRVFGLSNQKIKTDDWFAFRPENILKAYGVPDRINIYVIESPVAYSYGFVLYYNQLVVDYLEGGIVLSKNTHICPLANHQIQQFDFLVGKELKHNLVGEKSVEDLTQLSVNDFYNLLTGDPKKACLDINFDSYSK